MDTVDKHKIIEEWDYARNNKLGLYPDKLTCGSGKKAYWVCGVSKEHSWKADIKSRIIRNRGCSYCSGKKAWSGNTIANNDELMSQWDCNLNMRQPTEYTKHSNKKVHWVCKNGHCWKATINSRHSNGCPYCAGQKACKGNCLETTHPNLIKEWDFDKNIIKPTEITYGSTKLVSWVCKNGHSWDATINSRHSNGCPYCSNKRVCENNSLATTHPDLIKEWDFDKNIIKPTEITYGSKKKIWWKCQQNKTHSWQSTPNHRTNGRSCPRCSKNISKISQKWLDSLEIPNKYREKRIKINGKTFITDAYVPETNTVYEFNGDFWHGNPQIYKPDDINVVSKKTFSKLYKQTVEKANLIKKAGYLLISIWEHDFYQNKQKVIIIDVSLNT